MALPSSSGLRSMGSGEGTMDAFTHPKGLRITDCRSHSAKTTRTGSWYGLMRRSRIPYFMLLQRALVRQMVWTGMQFPSVRGTDTRHIIGDFLLAHKFQGRLVEEDPSSQVSLNRISEWVGSCNQNHSDWNPGCVPLLSRVLGVGDSPSDPIRLWETKGAYGYCTVLSHYWGTSTPYTTTCDTIDDIKKGRK
jgi:hypothetical protein